MQILIVDDDDFALSVLDKTLTRLGYTPVLARDGQQAMDILRHGQIRVVVTDWDMPGLNGLDLCRSVRREDLSGYVYLIMLTGREGSRQRLEGLYAGADDFLTKPLDAEELLVCLKTAERILSLETREVALFALAKLGESRDKEAGDHVERVQCYSRLLAQNLSPEMRAGNGVDDDYVSLIYHASLLHDLGKVGIPDAVLLKPGKLTPEEFEVVKKHTDIGARTLDVALKRCPDAKFLLMARDIAATHHEHYDGTGYPKGFAGDQIPLCGRIVGLADVYDALTSRRIYTSAITHDNAKALILSGKGTQFDPEVVEAFLRAEEKFIAVRLQFPGDDQPSTVIAADSIPIPEPHPPERRRRQFCKILVVDDDPMQARLLAKILGATGEPVFTAADGEEALKVLAAETPRLVVSDWGMPNMDGVELCRRIRKQQGADDPVHFIMLTASSDKSRLLEAYDAGADDFVAKPCDTHELLARVRVGLRTTKLRDELVIKTAVSQAVSNQLATMNSRLERLSITDELTGLFNRRHAMTRLQEQWSLSIRHDKPLAVAMMDIDHFKKINDTHGHDAGDAVLRQVSSVLRGQTRGTDIVCRVGGEEFLIILPFQSADEVRICAERCRAAIDEQPFEIPNGQLHVTISIGLAGKIPAMATTTDLVKAADQALYAAKAGGRNRVCLAGPTGSTESTADTLPAQNPTPKENTVPNENPVPTENPSVGNHSAVEPGAPRIAPGHPPVDFAAVVKRCGGDIGFVGMVMERFAGQARDEIARIEDALAHADAELLHRAAHNLKSMAAYMSVDAAAEQARRIEELARDNRLADVAPALICLRCEIDRAAAWITANHDAWSKRCA